MSASLAGLKQCACGGTPQVVLGENYSRWVQCDCGAMSITVSQNPVDDPYLVRAWNGDYLSRPSPSPKVSGA